MKGLDMNPFQLDLLMRQTCPRHYEGMLLATDETLYNHYIALMLYYLVIYHLPDQDHPHVYNKPQTVEPTEKNYLSELESWRKSLHQVKAWRK